MTLHFELKWWFRKHIPLFGKIPKRKYQIFHYMMKVNMHVEFSHWDFVFWNFVFSNFVFGILSFWNFVFWNFVLKQIVNIYVHF